MFKIGDRLRVIATGEIRTVTHFTPGHDMPWLTQGETGWNSPGNSRGILGVSGGWWIDENRLGPNVHKMELLPRRKLNLRPKNV